MIHVTITMPDERQAIDLARRVYVELAAKGRHTLLDTPGDFMTSHPAARLSDAEVMISARKPFNLNPIAS